MFNLDRNGAAPVPAQVTPRPDCYKESNRLHDEARNHNKGRRRYISSEAPNWNVNKNQGNIHEKHVERARRSGFGALSLRGVLRGSFPIKAE